MFWKIKKMLVSSTNIKKYRAEIIFLMSVNFFNGNLSYTKFSKEKGGIKESYFKQTKIIGGINHD
ncbi:hypothetical protein EG862_13575 [Enterococcus faecium]|nr:hypothetical protein EG862_13575 [Enterococcus faecium]